MKFAVDEVSFERGGTEVHIRKKSGIEQATSVQPIKKRIARRFVKDLGPASARRVRLTFLKASCPVSHRLIDAQVKGYGPDDW
jgi:hypothetical protein